MKKLLCTVLAATTFTVVANCQELKSATPPPAPMSKEDKEKMKQKNEADLAAAFKEIGANPDQVKLAQSILDEASAKNREIKKDVASSEETKKEKMKEVNEAKNEKLKALLGDKYKMFTELRKKQKEASMNMPQPMKVTPPPSMPAPIKD